MRSSPFLLLLLAGQGLYYLLTGLWPIVHMESFLAVTGPKVDLWLVRTVGLLIVGSAAVFLLSAWRRRVPTETAVLAVANALGLALIDIIYVGAGRIAPIYLADAAPELLLAFLLVVAWRTARPLGDLSEPPEHFPREFT